jgi:hypothetical protein
MTRLWATVYHFRRDWVIKQSRATGLWHIYQKTHSFSSGRPVQHAGGVFATVGEAKTACIEADKETTR